jgi:hypothetical protein
VAVSNITFLGLMLHSLLHRYTCSGGSTTSIFSEKECFYELLSYEELLDTSKKLYSPNY